jgi:hypothetical protein
MLFHVPLELCLVSTVRGYVLTKEFYELSLANKYEVVRQLEEDGRIEDKWLYDKIVKAILQHSDNITRRDYPVRGERRARNVTREADMQEALQALLVNWDALEPLIESFASSLFKRIVAKEGNF